MKGKLLLCACAFAGFGATAQSYYYNGAYFVGETDPVYVSASDAPNARPGYTLIWSDEFEYANISELTTGLSPKWNYGTSTTMDTYYADPTNHVSFVANDHSQSLSIELEKLSTPLGGQSFASTLLMTEGKKEFIYGYFEARCKFSNGRGAWPAFWLFGNTGLDPLCEDGNPNNNPAIGGFYNEIDIFENFPEREEARNMTHNIHVWQYNCAVQEVNPTTYGMHHSNMQPAFSTRYTGDIDLADEYHVYGMEFKPDSVVFYLDGVRIGHNTNTTLIDKLEKNSMWITLDNAVQLASVDFYTPNSMYFDIDYVRVYKKNPVVSVTSNSCSPSPNTTVLSASLPFVSTLPTGAAVTYSWAISGALPPTATGSSVTVTRTGTNPFTATVTATLTYPDYAGAVSPNTETEVTSAVFKYPDNIHTNTFSIGAPQCVSGNIRVTATAISNPPGGLWQLWNTNGSGQFTGSALQSGYGTSFTTTVTLTQGTTYAITRGVWDACTPWNFVQKNFTVDMAAFTTSAVTCVSNQLQVTCTALSNNNGGFEWHLYPCDAAGNIPPGSTPVTKYTNPCTYTNLTPGNYYRIFQGIYGGCVNPWTTSSQVLYVPDLYMNPNYTMLTFDPTPATYFTAAAWGAAQITPNHQWLVYSSNAAGAPLSQIGAAQSTTSASWGASYNLQNNTYYLFVHAVYGGCSNWRWAGKLLYNTMREGRPFTDIQDVEFTKEQIEQLEASSGLISHAPALQLFPNPAAEQVTLLHSGFTGEVTIEVINVQGKVMQTLTNISDPSLQLDLARYPAGVYLVRINDGKNSVTQRLVRE